MGVFDVWIIAAGVGFGLFFGLNALGREIRTGMVEAAKISKGEDIQTPDVNG